MKRPAFPDWQAAIDRATCPVTVWPTNLDRALMRWDYQPCGLPTVTDLCAKHQADRVRLGGAA